MNYNNKHIAILSAFFISSTVLVGKLAQLQLFDDSYKRIAERTILDKEVKFPSRGNIYDRNNKLLTFNKPIYDLECVYKNVDWDMDTTFFCELLDIEKKDFIENIQKDWSSHRYHKSIPFVFLSKINPQNFTKFQEHLFRFPGFYPVLRNIRAYPHENASHLLGYLGEVDLNQVNDASSDYERGDFIGKSGLEKTYEKVLKGQKGVEFLIRDNVGREVSSFNKGSMDSLSQAGTDLFSSIDLDLQQYCEELMTSKRGSVVAIEPSSGEILAMVSAPAYDPNLLNLDKNRGKAYLELRRDKIQKPLLDRSISARYPPGSIFKPVLSLIALQEGVFSKFKTVSCNGYYEYRTFKFGCHRHASPCGLKCALINSCNSYFFEMVRRLIEKEGYQSPATGLNILKEHLQDFGLGSELGVDLTSEQGGFIPSPSYYDNLYNEPGVKWRSTYIMSIGIGQGELDLTTLQMANLATIIANRGYYITPHLVKGFSNPKIQLAPAYSIKKQVRIDSSHFETVIDGMRQAILYGTGYRANTAGITICGKTGTSQNPHGDDHSVFFAFAPRENPKIAIAIYVENAGFGGDIAAPIAGLVIEKYIKGEIKRPNLHQQMVDMDLISKDLPEIEKEEETNEDL